MMFIQSGLKKIKSGYGISSFNKKVTALTHLIINKIILLDYKLVNIKHSTNTGSN